MLNIPIQSHKTLTQLVATIVEELRTKTDELKELNKVGEIKSELEKMYLSTREEANKKLSEIKEKFNTNETEFRTKLCSYVRLLKDNIVTLAQGDDSKIELLKKKIEALIGEKLGVRKKDCGKSSGKLVDLEYKIREANKKYNYYGTPNFMKRGRIDSRDFQKVLEVQDKTYDFVRLSFGYLGKIYETQEKLCYILVTLTENTQFGTIISEIDRLTKEKIDTYEEKIDYHEAKVHLLNTLSVQIDPYKKSLERNTEAKGPPKGLKDVIEAVKELKKCVQDNKQYLDQTFVKEVAEITDITDNDLDDITNGIQEIIEIVDLIQKYVDNTKLFFVYLKIFQSYKSKIDLLQIKGDNISDIQNTISSIEAVISTITKVQDPIHKAKQAIEGKFQQTWSNIQRREQAMDGIKKQYFPEDLKVFDDLGRFDGHVKKLRSIENFDDATKTLDIGKDLIRIEKMQKVTTINELSSQLIGINRIVSLIEKGIRTGVEIIQSSHESTKSNLNGSPNGNSIEEHVGEIKKIPEKLYKLHDSVRIYINLRQIVSNVVRTLDRMETKTLELRKTNNTLGSIVKNLKSILELKSFEFHANPHWDDDIIEQKIRELYQSNLSIRAVVPSARLTMFGIVAIMGTVITIKCSTRIVDTALRIYRHFKP